jgi:microcystin-dependent protein
MGFFGGSRAVLNEMTAAWETARTKRGIGEQRAQMYIGSGGLLRAQYGSHDPITIANLAQPASTAAAVPTGAVFQWVLPVAPVGFLLCDGRVVSTTEYPELFALIGTMFGEGGGGGFRLPNMGGRVPVGAGSPSFPDSFSGSLYVGATGGSPAMEISSINMPEHSHGISALEHSHTLSSHDHSVTGLVAEAHTHLIDFTTSTAYDVTGNEYTDLSHDHSLDVDLNIETDGARQYVDEDGGTSNSQPDSLLHTHTSSVFGGASDTVTVTSSGDHSHTVVSSGTAASAGAHYHDIASSGGNATITDDGEHSHTVDGLTGSEGEHTHPVIFDGESGTEEDTGHAHTVVSSGTANSAGAHAHDLSSSGGEAIISDDGVHLHSVAINTDTDGAHGHTATFDEESETESGGIHTHTLSVATAGLHDHTILTTADGSHTHYVTGSLDSHGEHSHTVGTLVNDAVGDHDHSASGSYLSTADGAHGHTLDFELGDNLDQEDPDLADYAQVDARTVIEDAGGHNHIAADAGGHDHVVTISENLSIADDLVIANTELTTATVSGITADIANLTIDSDELPDSASADNFTINHDLDTTMNSIPAADVSAVTVNSDGTRDPAAPYDNNDISFDLFDTVDYLIHDRDHYFYSTGDIYIMQDIGPYEDFNQAHTHQVTIPAQDVNQTDHSHDIEGNVTVVNGDLSNTSHNHTLAGSVDVGGGDLANTAHAHNLNGSINLNGTITASDATAGAHTHTIGVEGPHDHEAETDTHIDIKLTDRPTDTEAAHTHSITVNETAAGGHNHTISGNTGSDGEHTHDITNLDTSQPDALHTHTGDTSTAPAHTHGATAVNDTGHTHPIDVDTIGIAISNTDGAHAHDVDGNTGEDTAGHYHTLSGFTETDGAHTHTVNTTGTTASAGVHAHALDAESNAA